MSQYKPVKKTSFLEAVAACIQHEKKVFEFYLRNSESLQDGSVKEIFQQLAEDADDHIKMVSDLYTQIKGGEVLPNLKMASQVQNLNSSSIQKLMTKLDRNTEADAGGDELKALALATREHEDAAEFFEKMKEKFEDPNAKFLFAQMESFQSECRMLLESYSAYLSQGTPYSQPSGYWDMEP
ncbi:MAG: ferritin family protein [Leptospiraceae bacterium]|nr:ferritin family protein [Leptospiraceae bacterium]MCB1304992.1 ferritin family protein [Leptospiraceae bacterium]